MSVHRVAYRYAKSLIGLAQEQNKLDTVLGDFDVFLKVNEGRDFSNMVKSPIIKADKKKAIFSQVFSGKLDKLTESFFDIILNKGREALLPAIAAEFTTQYKALKHISPVRLITAQPLSEAALEDIRKKILASDATDEEVELEVLVDESLIGGFIIEYDSKRFDSSVAAKLAALRKEFEQNKYVKQF